MAVATSTRFSLATIQPLKLRRVSAVTMPGKRVPRSLVEVCMVSEGVTGVVMKLSFLCCCDCFDLCVATRIDQIWSEDRDRDFYRIGSLSIPAHFLERFLVYLFLKFDHARDEGLWCGRATRNVDVYRQELINSCHDVITFLE